MQLRTRWIDSDYYHMPEDAKVIKKQAFLLFFFPVLVGCEARFAEFLPNPK
ncbi:hypothetical protein M422DRAFT_263919 [Sphaerobolus stellatus SS14]|uniref:Uncharacterized protein n=1 Tax=Sphaerobolus stellatus (strain SS14) TaxID=990650 RepID=A0A0C9V9M0_SPHS4|nr:hypothetical protein M422DRAFT_263919 [Sphaerobolus stellatus SS14]